MLIATTVLASRTAHMVVSGIYSDNLPLPSPHSLWSQQAPIGSGFFTWKEPKPSFLQALNHQQSSLDLLLWFSNDLDHRAS